jgi:isoleucyl-tRNA synthetase
MRVAVPPAVRGAELDALLPLLAAEVNVKAVALAADRDLVRLRGKPNFRTLGKVYGKDTPAAARAAAALDDDALRALEAGGEVEAAGDGRTWRFRPEDVVVERDVATDWLIQSAGPLVVALDPSVTDELRREGIAREVVNRVQRLRKEAGYEYTARITLSVSGDGEVLAASDAFRGFIAGETLARQVELGNALADPDVQETADIDGRRVVIAVKRHGAPSMPR